MNPAGVTDTESARKKTQPRNGRVTTGTVMLALSTFRQSEEAVALAAEKAVHAGRFVIVFVVDVNLARYLMPTDVGLYPNLKEKCERELLEEHRREAEERARRIADRMARKVASVDVYTVTGRFGIECMRVVESERPDVIVTTRSKRPEWLRRLFGSPVDYLIEHAGCPVIET